MSDLQCPARLYVVWPASDAGSARPPDPVPGDERLAAVYDDPDDLPGIVDLHRGEAVLVRVSAAPSQLPWLEPGASVAVEADGDGWRVV